MADWRGAFRRHWQQVLAPAYEEQGDAWQTVIAWCHLGLAPIWLLNERSRADFPPEGFAAARREALQAPLPPVSDAAILASLHRFTLFFRIVSPEEVAHPHFLPLYSRRWEERLAGLLALTDPQELRALPHFATDGNRLTRFAARYRQAEPDRNLLSEETP